MNLDRSRTFLGALASLAACSGPGELQWEGGRAPLRTAFWQRRDLNNVTLALSTSEFPCALELFGDDPAEIALNQLELQTAACREGARHLVIELWRQEGALPGVYPGRSTTAMSGARFSTAKWFAVEEAGVLYIDGINRSYSPSGAAWEVVLDGAAGGEVHVSTGRPEVKGDLWLPEIGVSADFHAVECPAGPTLNDDLFDDIDLVGIGC